MPLYMDVHRKLGPIKPDDLAQAHLRDVETQTKYGVCYHKYWINQQDGTVFCLVEGPNKEACDHVHREAHGLVADDIIEVEPRLVEAFLLAGPPNPAGAALTVEGGYDLGVRVVLLSEVSNYAEVANCYGDDVALQMARTHDGTARELLTRHNGRDVANIGEALMVCFSSVASALRFATELQERCVNECEPISGLRPRIRMGIAAGEPVEAHRDLFGACVTAARRICETAQAGEVLVSGAVRELAVGKGFTFAQRGTTYIEGVGDPLHLYRLQLQAEAAAVAVAVPPLAVRRRVHAVRAFWRELKRRHVVSVAAIYAGVLFLLLQVAELTFHALGLPTYAYTMLLVLGLFGFPLAVILAWAFDLK